MRIVPAQEFLDPIDQTGHAEPDAGRANLARHFDILADLGGIKIKFLGDRGAGIALPGWRIYFAES